MHASGKVDILAYTRTLRYVSTSIEYIEHAISHNPLILHLMQPSRMMTSCTLPNSRTPSYAKDRGSHPVNYQSTWYLMLSPLFGLSAVPGFMQA